MAIKYKINITKALYDAGYSAYKIRQNKLLSEGTLSRLRNNELVSLASLDTICGLLKMQPGDLIEYYNESI